MKFGIKTIKTYIAVLIGVSCSAGWAGGMGKTCIEIDAGWVIVNYYNPIEVADSYHHGRTKESNFALSGPYVGLKWSGDRPS